MTPLVLSDHQKQDIREAVEEIRRVMRDIEAQHTATPECLVCFLQDVTAGIFESCGIAEVDTPPSDPVVIRSN
jgi:hypothetical protein